jgi:hypothetical protein
MVHQLVVLGKRHRFGNQQLGFVGIAINNSVCGREHNVGSFVGIAGFIDADKDFYFLR